jgi:hypothetical protein
MTLHYTLKENDFLQHQLFAASKSKRIKRQRLRNWFISSAALLCMSWIFYQEGNGRMTEYFLITGILCFGFYPLYQKWYYKRHYRKFIAETYKNRFGQPEEMKFTKEWVEVKDVSGESKIKLAEVESISETGNYFYLQIKTGGHLVIPKTISEVDFVRQQLKEICYEFNIAYCADLKWK